MRRLLILFLCAAELLLFSGRGGLRGSRREVEQLLVVQTMGLDADSGGVTLSLAAPADAESGVTRLSAYGVTVSAAMERIRGYAYREELFCPHIQRVLLGEKAAEQGVESALAYVCRSPDLRLDLPLFVVRESTAEAAVMEAGGEAGICSVMRTVEQEARRHGACSLTTVSEVLRDTLSCGSALVCALELGKASETTDGAEDSGLSAAPLGYAVLREGRLCRYLTREQGIAVGLLKNRVSPATLRVRDRGGSTAVLELTGGSSRIRPVWDKGTLTGLTVECQARARVLELGGRGALKGTEDADYLTAQLEAQLARYVRETLQAAQELKADFLCLQELVARSRPAALRTAGRDFVELLPALRLEITVSARLGELSDMK